ncbi:MAG: hypothetical protein OEZ38_02015 [Gammaproteobacteria bacterium]|nr:hypothetical protein [Gammaproteobacteria bacterium]
MNLTVNRLEPEFYLQLVEVPPSTVADVQSLSPPLQHAHRDDLLIQQIIGHGCFFSLSQSPDKSKQHLTGCQLLTTTIDKKWPGVLDD